MMRFVFRVWAVVSVCAMAVAAPRLIYVSPTGDDAADGTTRRAAKGPHDAVRTLPRALKLARELRATGSVKEGITIQLQGGRYELAEPLQLTPADSGESEMNPLVIESRPGESAVLSGGSRMTDWKPSPENPKIMEAGVPGVKEGKVYFRQLFVNGQRRQRARTPNEGFFRIDGPSPQDKPVKLHYRGGEIKKEWANVGDVEVIALLAWSDFRYFIRSVDEVSHVAVLSGDPRPSNREDRAKYYIENAPDGLDSAGEWYLDRKRGVVRYWPVPGENMGLVEAVAGRLNQLVLLKGDPANGRAVKHVKFKGLTLAHTDWTMPMEGYADTQAAVAVRGDFFAEAAEHCVIENCVFQHLGGYAVEWGRGCKNNKVTGCEMFDLGAGGVRVGEGRISDKESDQVSGMEITDNHIHHLGRVFPPAVGVFIMQSSGNRVAHNEINDLYYTAVSAGWTWGYREGPCHDNVIEFNHMHHVGLNLLSDMGAVYTLGPQKGTVVRNNLIHDVEAFTYGGWGLYPDEGSAGILFENNVVYRCKSAGFHQHYGKENVVRNNIFAFNRENQLMRTRNEEHISFFFTNNIVVFNTGSLLGSSWQNDRYVMDSNVYWDTRLKGKEGQLKFGGATLEAWKGRGHDEHSVIADPLFEAAENGDFRLKKGSPALALGFKPIHLENLGVRKLSQRHVE